MAHLTRRLLPHHTDVQKRYKKLALQLHPDKVGDAPEHVDRFQAATTAYQVLSSDTAQEAYWQMYRLRCYLFQLGHEAGQPLAPFYCMRVKKKDDRGLAQDRLLTLDLREGSLQNWRKDKPHKKSELSNIKEVKQTGECGFTIVFKAGRDYKLTTESAAGCSAYVSVLQAIVSRSSWMPDDDGRFPPARCPHTRTALRARPSAEPPPESPGRATHLWAHGAHGRGYLRQLGRVRSTKKGYVEKRGKSGEWSRRWLLLGSSSLLIFRTQECTELVNVVPLDPSTCSASKAAESIEWTVSTGPRRYIFRNSKSALAQRRAAAPCSVW